ncbi:TetR/AcrR family transcriptional regulator [Micromonospora sp. DR5-3]|uniref:TetR/AcrR family transcriptional regulator n=1 Tax=unclassified Micromonospora TaxID=2617518 RepID=UPI0011DC1467|nr:MULTISPECIES: TetR/AcrR family transcriptional regulator [unclassified Micromonospora]MCW3820806.1 TetR/AcrR family transcriptional regulator [Micromonospora sp. DR5-3]TYC11448.1 TetR/AcrR family transcriptional regulator [Micromonospora sp. MP36]
MTDQHQTRPGGRTARVRADVLRAVDDLTAEQPLAQLTLTQVAERSGVHLGTLYRRWGSLDGLLLDAVAERLTNRSPVRDTGNLRADLEDYAHRAAEDLSGPDGKLLLRTLVAVRLGTDAELPPALTRRFEDMQALLDRATARGEKPPTLQQIMDIVVAPLYTALLFGTGPTNPATLINRLQQLHPDL